MSRASSCPSSGAQQLQSQPLVLPLERGGSSAVVRGRPGRQLHVQQRSTYAKPEAASVVLGS
jgi:hypothetical protein